MTKEATANQIVVVDGVAHEVLSCPDGVMGCEVLHLGPPILPTPVPADKPTDRPSEGQQAAPELKPCPFCLKPVAAREIKGAGYSLVGCNDPSCVASAISALPVDWNTRADLRTVSDAGEAQPSADAKLELTLILAQWTLPDDLRAALNHLKQTLDRAAASTGREAVDRYVLGDVIRLAYLKHGKDSWCSIADDVIAALNLDEANNYSDET